VPHSRSRTIALAIGFLVGMSGEAGAQLTTPSEWRWRLDRPARLVTGQEVPDSAWRFVGMPPGWHVTTGPGVTLFNPTERAAGRYSISAAFVLFPHPGDDGYGLVFGGADLGSADAARLAVQLRRDGAVRVVAERLGQEQALSPWTLHPAIRPAGAEPVTNRMRVAVAPDSVRVFVNDTAVAAIGVAGLATEGQFGFRIGGGLNLHITTLDLTRHLAPARGS